MIMILYVDSNMKTTMITIALADPNKVILPIYGIEKHSQGPLEMFFPTDISAWKW